MRRKKGIHRFGTRTYSTTQTTTPKAITNQVPPRSVTSWIACVDHGVAWCTPHSPALLSTETSVALDRIRNARIPTRRPPTIASPSASVRASPVAVCGSTRRASVRRSHGRFAVSSASSSDAASDGSCPITGVGYRDARKAASVPPARARSTSTRKGIAFEFAHRARRVNSVAMDAADSTAHAAVLPSLPGALPGRGAARHAPRALGPGSRAAAGRAGGACCPADRRHASRPRLPRHRRRRLCPARGADDLGRSPVHRAARAGARVREVGQRHQPLARRAPKRRRSPTSPGSARPSPEVS